jgi:hypothetical protein
MPNKPHNAVRVTAKNLFKEVTKAKKRNKAIAKDESMVRPLRKHIIDRDKKQSIDPKGRALLNAMQFAKTAGSTEKQINNALIKGAGQGIFRGHIDNILGRK